MADQALPVQEQLLLACKCALKWLRGEYALLDDEWLMGELEEAITAAEWEPIRLRIEAAAAGQPPIVKEAMLTGVSVLRMGLTDKERGQLQRARRKGLLVWDPNWHFNRPTTLICDPSIAHGGQSETTATDVHK